MNEQTITTNWSNWTVLGLAALIVLSAPLIGFLVSAAPGWPDTPDPGNPFWQWTAYLSLMPLLAFVLLLMKRPTIALYIAMIALLVPIFTRGLIWGDPFSGMNPLLLLFLAFYLFLGWKTNSISFD